ncbi:MAG TPA: DUF2147 domain-containing protein [Rudaea sp.]|jgi:uncharacterized protein (DUF2147 family)|nr:DUF2147 domain-containing protein [Rudaea sp.]
MRLLTLSLLLISGSVFAADRTPIGTWKTIDDDTHEPKALVEITEHDGALSGHVVKLFRKPSEDQNPKCKECSGDRKDQPIMGMTILWNLRRDGDEWNGGEIIDPDGGKIYRCKLQVDETGTRLDVRGFIGFSLLGRTQVWERVESP